MAKLLMWFGAVIAVWSLTISGHKSAYYILAVLGYLVVTWYITFGGSKRSTSTTLDGA